MAVPEVDRDDEVIAWSEPEPLGRAADPAPGGRLLGLLDDEPLGDQFGDQPGDGAAGQSGTGAQLGTTGGAGTQRLERPHPIEVS